MSSTPPRRISYVHKATLDSAGLAIPGNLEIEENYERLCFWRPPDFLCQWSFVEFDLNGIKFSCAEQAMMHNKAMLFDDSEVAQKILAARHPKDYLALGRTVKGFKSEVWDANKFAIVEQANYAKFSQNPLFKSALLATGSKFLVEASPLDKIWGIGLDPKTAINLPESKFQGENLLGKALMKVRDRIRKESESASSSVSTSSAAAGGAKSKADSN